MGMLDELYAAKNQAADSLESDVIGHLDAAVSDLEDIANTVRELGGDVSTTLQDIAGTISTTKDRVDEIKDTVLAEVSALRDWTLG
jgi:ABC-type transporter Mla subunit MlaD